MRTFTFSKGVFLMIKRRKPIVVLYTGLLSLNLAAWLFLTLATQRFPFLFPMGLLAYVFGLRHGADADHIAAIDNTTRKLTNERKSAFGVGLFFSLGHSTVVIALSIGLAIAAHFVKAYIPALEHYGSLMGTMISAAFLYLIAFLNLAVLKDVFQLFREIKLARNDDGKLKELEELLLKRGFMSRFFQKLFKTIDASWKMYPIGVLFGLGFDTASEIALLGLSASAGSKDMPVVLVLILPLLFMAGMTLVDTTDGIVMQYAYHWAFVNPVRKAYYNLSITGISVFVALAVGGIEWLQVMSMEFSLKGPFWNLLNTISFSNLGFIIIGILFMSWLLAILVYKVRGYDQSMSV
ncbi:high-affinity nickel transport protein [Peptococcaceae bacterium CEB3]|nr:high-affinity nickel transport protein [Peptococcaceae bacterium CEB3]